MTLHRRQFAFALFAAACGAGPLAHAQTTERVLVVATGSTFRPYGFTTPDRKIVGFDIDLLNAVAAQQGLRLRYESTPFSAIFPALENGDRDLAVAAITITAQRRERADFSNPYLAAQLMVLLNSNVSANSLEELRTRRIGVALNSTGDTVVSEAFGRTASNIRRFENTPLLLEELNQGGVDAAVADRAVLAFYQRNNPERRFRALSDARFKPAWLGIAVRKGNSALLERLNAGLRQIVDSGEYRRIHEKWFGSPPTGPLPASWPG